MITITLPPELERAAKEGAKQQGTTPELWALDKLRRSLEADPGAAIEPVLSSDDGSMLDFFEGYVGTLHSSEYIPGGAQMSQDTGRKFAQGMVEKRKSGKL